MPTPISSTQRSESVAPTGRVGPKCAVDHRADHQADLWALDGTSQIVAAPNGLSAARLLASVDAITIDVPSNVAQHPTLLAALSPPPRHLRVRMIGLLFDCSKELDAELVALGLSLSLMSALDDEADCPVTC